MARARRGLGLLLMTLVSSLLLGAVATAQSPTDLGASPWVERPQARLRLISATTAVGQAPTLLLGLEIVQKTPWKIYWRSPGDAGTPPVLDWRGSVNLARAELAWPVPQRFTVSSIETVGYAGTVVFPLHLRPETPGAPVVLALALEYLTCAEICVPERASFSLLLPPGPATPSAHAQTLAQALAQIPSAQTSHGLTITQAGVEPDGTVRVSVAADPPMEAPDLFLEPPAGLSFARPEVRLEEGGRRAILRARPSAGHVPSHGSLSALIADGSRGVELSVDTSVRLAPPTGLPFAGTVPLWASMALLAWLGGLILNLMPCVLPVLSLKVLGVLGHAGGTGQGARLSFLASSAGILTSFLVLAGAAIGLKAAGAVVGWGIQFQQPVFLAAMAAILTLFAANLWSVFEIPLPGALASLGGRPGQGSPAGAFATGAFATVLATPCSAPFLGTAVGFALSGGPWETLGIFALLGLGMATPYLLLAAWPGFVRFLPRPGRWMLRLKAFLGLALAGTAAWLLQVLSAQTSPGLAVAVAGVLGLVLALLLAGARWPAVRRAVLGLAVGVGLAAPALPLILATDPPSTSRADGLWRPWSPEAVNALVAEGKVVLVDVTAQWCTTCQVNKIGVLDRGRVAAALAEGRLSGLVADWTRPDPAIAAYLASFGRYGIPFAAVYGPGAPQGIPLPDLLSEQAVLDAMERAVR